MKQDEKYKRRMRRRKQWADNWEKTSVKNVARETIIVDEMMKNLNKSRTESLLEESQNINIKANVGLVLRCKFSSMRWRCCCCDVVLLSCEGGCVWPLGSFTPLAKETLIIIMMMMTPTMRRRTTATTVTTATTTIFKLENFECNYCFCFLKNNLRLFFFFFCF